MIAALRLTVTRKLAIVVVCVHASPRCRYRRAFKLSIMKPMRGRVLVLVGTCQNRSGEESLDFSILRKYLGVQRIPDAVKENEKGKENITVFRKFQSYVCWCDNNMCPEGNQPYEGGGGQKRISRRQEITKAKSRNGSGLILRYAQCTRFGGMGGYRRSKDIYYIVSGMRLSALGDADTAFDIEVMRVDADIE